MIKAFLEIGVRFAYPMERIYACGETVDTGPGTGLPTSPMSTETLPGNSLDTKDVDCQSCATGSGSLSGLPVELQTLMECYFRQKDYAFNWKMQGAKCKQALRCFLGKEL